MKKNFSKNYDSLKGSEISCFGGMADQNGTLLDIHETLYHSHQAGFYLKRQIRQIRRGRTWETASIGESEEQTGTEEIRFLVVYRPMSPDQTIIYIVKTHMPEAEGIRCIALRALDQGGISIR
jgi:hypothetical protein